MLKQHFKLNTYDWNVYSFYYVTRLDCDEIMSLLVRFNHNKTSLKEAYDTIHYLNINNGYIYTNLRFRVSIIVVGKTSSRSEFMNSLVHEIKHLTDHIGEYYNIPPYSEESSYLIGDIAGKVFKVASKYLQKVHNNKIN